MALPDQLKASSQIVFLRILLTIFALSYNQSFLIPLELFAEHFFAFESEQFLQSITDHPHLDIALNVGAALTLLSLVRSLSILVASLESESFGLDLALQIGVYVNRIEGCMER
jgi:hypothetical protein